MAGKFERADHGPAGLAQPEFVRWGFGGRDYSSLVEAQSADFHFRFLPCLERRPFSLREEVVAAARRIDEARAGRRVALCYTGGIDSELIATVFSQLGIPYELYFLDLWGLNRAAFDAWAPAFEKKAGKSVRIVSIERKFFYEEQAMKTFAELGVENPTYLALPYLFEAIPADEFIVTGDGDLNRSGPLYKAIARLHPAPSADSACYLPFSTASTAYWQWAGRRGRPGEYCFFSSTPSLIAAVLTHPLFRVDYPVCDTRRILLSEFPEIAARPKTTNWDGGAYRENVWIRAWVERLGMNSAELKPWREALGTVVRMDDLFLP